MCIGSHRCTRIVAVDLGLVVEVRASFLSFQRLADFVFAGTELPETTPAPLTSHSTVHIHNTVSIQSKSTAWRCLSLVSRFMQCETAQPIWCITVSAFLSVLKLMSLSTGLPLTAHIWYEMQRACGMLAWVSSRVHSSVPSKPHRPSDKFWIDCPLPCLEYRP